MDQLVAYNKPVEGIARITLRRPEALNAINLAMRDELWTFVHAAVWDPDVRVLVFAGEGRAFSAGADIREFGTAESLHAAREARRQRDLWALLDGAHPVAGCAKAPACGVDWRMLTMRPRHQRSCYTRPHDDHGGSHAHQRRPATRTRSTH